MVSESATPLCDSLGRREGATGSPPALVFLSELITIRNVVGSMLCSFYFDVLLTAISQPVAPAINVELTAEPP
jgi:hypothetical protein